MKKTKSKSTPQTLHELLLETFGKESLVFSVTRLRQAIYKKQCTFENDFWVSLRDRSDKRFEKYNKATGLGRSAFILQDNSSYKDRAIMCAALTAYIEMLKENE